MTKTVVLKSGVLIADTIASIEEPATVNATTVGGVKVVVPYSAAQGDTVILNQDGTAPAGTLVEGTNLFSVVDAANDLVTVTVG